MPDWVQHSIVCVQERADYMSQLDSQSITLEKRVSLKMLLDKSDDNLQLWKEGLREVQVLLPQGNEIIIIAQQRVFKVEAVNIMIFPDCSTPT